MKKKTLTKRSPLKLPIKDGVLACVKDVRKGRATVWVDKHADVKAGAATLKEAEELLVEKIWSLCDLDEPFALRYKSTKSEAVENLGKIFRITANEDADTSSPGDYFTKGFCPTCQSGLGSRNAKILQLDFLEKKAKSGLLVRFQPYHKYGLRVGMCLIHADVCKALKLNSNPLLEVREVTAKGKPMGNFREIIGRQLIPCPIPLARQGRVGGVCSKCRAEFIYHEVGKEYICDDGAALIRKYGAAAIGAATRPTLCVTGKNWKRIEKLESARGLLAEPVSILAKSEINHRPKLEKIWPLKL